MPNSSLLRSSTFPSAFPASHPYKTTTPPPFDQQTPSLQFPQSKGYPDKRFTWRPCISSRPVTSAGWDHPSVALRTPRHTQSVFLRPFISTLTSLQLPLPAAPFSPIELPEWPRTNKKEPVTPRTVGDIPEEPEEKKDEETDERQSFCEKRVTGLGHRRAHSEKLAERLEKVKETQAARQRAQTIWREYWD